MPYKLNDMILVMDAPFTVDRVNYPANWLANSTQAERDLLGVVWVAEQTRPDDRFYYVEDHGDGTYTATPKDLAACKAEMIAEVNQAAHSLLSITDWYVTRRMEMGTPIPPEADAKRTAIRECTDANVEAINAAVTLDQLAQFVPVWPPSSR